MPALPDNIRELDENILAFIARGMDVRDDAAFNSLALQVFEQQFEHIPLYRSWCLRRGAGPGSISKWAQIPALFTDAFKAADFAAFPGPAARTFMTSGTTGTGERGRISYDEGGLRLMDATIRTAAAAMLFPDGARAVILVIAPSPAAAPAMVMSYGMNRLIEYFGLPGSGFFIDHEGFRFQDLVDALCKCEVDRVPVALCGGTSGMLNFFERCADQGLRFALPRGSRCLDAGGQKKTAAAVTREEFVGRCSLVLGIEPQMCVNLLGMTETASQFYDDTIRSAHAGGAARAVKIPPPWTRTLVVDPDSLEPLAPGETGLLRHIDIANRGHVCAIQTDDLGRSADGGFQIFGRARDDRTRGCSLSIDEITAPGRIYAEDH